MQRTVFLLALPSAAKPVSAQCGSLPLLWQFGRFQMIWYICWRLGPCDHKQSRPSTHVHSVFWWGSYKLSCVIKQRSLSMAGFRFQPSWCSSSCLTWYWVYGVPWGSSLETDWLAVDSIVPSCSFHGGCEANQTGNSSALNLERFALYYTGRHGLYSFHGTKCTQPRTLV